MLAHGQPGRGPAVREGADPATARRVRFRDRISRRGVRFQALSRHPNVSKGDRAAHPASDPDFARVESARPAPAEMAETACHARLRRQRAGSGMEDRAPGMEAQSRRPADGPNTFISPRTGAASRRLRAEPARRRSSRRLAGGLAGGRARSAAPTGRPMPGFRMTHPLMCGTVGRRNGGKAPRSAILPLGFRRWP